MNKKEELISKFETGDKPSGEDFAELIEHTFNDDDIVKKNEIVNGDIIIARGYGVVLFSPSGTRYRLNIGSGGEPVITKID